MRAALTAVVLLAFALPLWMPVGEAQDAKAKSVERYENLKEYYRTYWAYHEANFQKAGRESPRSWQDLLDAGLRPSVKKFFDDNEFAVVFGLKFHELKNGTSEVMLAYSTKAVQIGPQQFGRIALFMDGHVGGMDDEEFKASQKILEPYLKKAVVQLPPKSAR